VTEDPKLAAARRVADELLAPTAEATDVAPLVPVTHLDALADAGLYGLAAPVELGGVAAPTSRSIVRAIAGGCGATGFVWVQHLGSVGQITNSPNAELRDRHLAALIAGQTRAGIAFAHLRRRDPTGIRLTVGPGGDWHLDGSAPWVTGWGRIDVVRLGTVDSERTLRWFLVPLDRPGLSSTPVALSVLSSTGTVELGLHGVPVSSDDLILEEPLDDWLEADRPVSSRVSPGVLGVIDRALRYLGEREPEVAGSLSRELDELDAQDAVGDTDPAAMAHHRARCLDLAARSTRALLAAVGGVGMELTHPAQRLAREASFYVVQAQNSGGRAATLDLAQR
jgi:alkylation response protein AidB-like acyl-CoA dehydrogenase